MKIEDLIEIINADFKKKCSENDFKNPHNYIPQLKNYLNLYTLCLLEICHDLHFIGLDFVSKSLFKLFQSFKIQYAGFLKLQIKFMEENPEQKQQKPQKKIKGNSNF